MPIPRTVSAARAVAHAERYSGSVPLKELERLAESTGGKGRLHADWCAGRDQAGHPQVRGRIEGALELVCQRCLKPFEWTVDLAVQLLLVESEAEAARLLHDADPYEVRDDQLPLREMTEDEVLLALPLMPRCKTCENIAVDAPPRDEPTGPNPFAALKKLKFPKT